MDEYNQLMTKNQVHFDKLEQIVRQCGEALEGNCMYQQGTFIKLPGLINKQRNLMTVSRAVTTALEIGFNAGHSALFMLLGNPNLKLLVIDICWHKYTKLCYEYIDSIFPGQVKLIDSNSNEALCSLSGSPYDLYHIDGSHLDYIANADFFLVRRHARHGSIIIYDDVELEQLNKLWVEYKKQKYVQEFYLLPTYVYGHAFGLMIKE
jgi:hypothetical protein